ncbi:MAG: KilA-N domain-containing protein [Bacteroidales bacterium]|jgi:ferredoxin|nr:KilA-N domain-containing protein [Bacteroidales bacterium]
MGKKETINVQGTEIFLYEGNKGDFISITDIARYRDSERSDYILQNWMRNRSTIEFIGLWEYFNNPDFNSIEFDGIKNMSGSNSFALTPKRWIESTNAIGIVSKTGRYGGTFAHKDIAFEFSSWLSSEFKFYLNKNGLTIPQINIEICVGCGGYEFICPVRPFRAIHVEGYAIQGKAKPFEEQKKEEKEIDSFGF